MAPGWSSLRDRQMSRKEVTASTFIQSNKQILPRVFQCTRAIDAEVETEWILSTENDSVVGTNFDCEVTCSGESSMTSNYKKPKKRGKKFKSPVYRDTETTTVDPIDGSWYIYSQTNDGSCELSTTTSTTTNNHTNPSGCDAETVEDIEKWLKTRTESISSIEMDSTKSEVDVNVGRYLGDELPHVFLEKHTDDLSIDIDLSDKKLNLGYDPILQELQSDKLLEVCEKDGFILPEFQLDQLDSLTLAPNDMVVAGEILPSTSNQSNLIDDPVEYVDSCENDNVLDLETTCDKSIQVKSYGLPDQLPEPSGTVESNHDNLHLHMIDETSTNFQNITTIPQDEMTSLIKHKSKVKSKSQPSIMKKCDKVPELNDDCVNIDENSDCRTVNENEIMAVVAISTDKRSNLTQIVINTGKGEQIYQGKTSELMKATGYFSKPAKINSTTWNHHHSVENSTNNVTMNSHEIIITKALEELGYTDDNLLSVALPEHGKAWICPREECRREFARLYALKSHLLSHYGVRPFKCDFEGCSWAFYSEFKLKRHKETHLKRKDYICPVTGCERRFTTVYNLWTHQKLHTRPSRLACHVPECEEKFQTKRALELHMKIHDQSHAPYVCLHEGCNKRYYSSNALTSHQRCHSYKEVDIKCSWPDCGKIFDKPCRLKAHLRSHTGSKPYICTFSGCQWAFSSSSKLKRHEKKHTNERKFICDVVGCSKAFMRSEHLKEHKLTHVEGRDFQCDVCVARFSAMSSLYVHIKKHHKETLEPSYLQPLEEEPQLNFVERDTVSELCNDLPLQMDVELLDNPIQIQLDDNNFSISSTASNDNIVENHNNTTVQSKPRFACPVENCARSYLTKSSLRTHTLKVHKEKSSVFEVDYEFLMNENNSMKNSDQLIELEPESTEILNENLESPLCFTETEPPPLSRIKNVQSHEMIDVNLHTRIKKSHGSARTGLTYSDIWKLKNKNPMTLNSIVGPSDVNLGSADLGEGLLLTEELPSMYYQDDIVGTECQILLLDSATTENTINLRDLQ